MMFVYTNGVWRQVSIPDLASPGQVLALFASVMVCGVVFSGIAVGLVLAYRRFYPHHLATPTSSKRPISHPGAKFNP